MTETDDDIWGDDLLGRREFADFLTKALVARTELISAKEGQRGWTVALDAAWGAGKSFFIKHWAADLRRQGYPVVLFDAWENDIGEEASVALMAEINEEMKQWISKLSKTKTVERKARALVVDAGRKLRKSVMPVAKVVASGMLQKAIGVGLQEILDSSDKAVSGESNDKPSLASSAEEVLDKVFDVSIHEHQRRKSDIRDFKKALVDLIDLIHEQAGAKYPLFVFIDELDRCRPTYAISMLEEVKHIFGMDKVCFVVSTNLSQLRHSICAVYGQEFDSEMYLKRFFDQSINLPVVVSNDHVLVLYLSSGVISSKKFFFPFQLDDFDEKSKLIEAMKWIFLAFGIDTRSQKQIFHMAESATLSVNTNLVHVVFLFFLCSLYQVNQSLFENLEIGGNVSDICKKSLKKDVSLSYRAVRGYQLVDVEIKLSELISCYSSFSKMQLEKLFELKTGYSSESPENLVHQALIDEFRSGLHDKQKKFPSISSYFNLVRYAGYLQ